MLRVRTVSAGWSGGPGLSTFYFDAADTTQGTVQSLVDRVRAYFEATGPLYPGVMTFTVDPEVALLDPLTGTQTGAFVAGGAPTAAVGSGGASFAPPMTMLLLRLVTNKFIGGRKLQGHSNVGPVAGGVVEPDGSPTQGARTLLATSGATLLDAGGASPDLLVWSRPKLTRPGSTGTVIGVSVPDKFAVLRSRRD